MLKFIKSLFGFGKTESQPEVAPYKVEAPQVAQETTKVEAVAEAKPAASKPAKKKPAAKKQTGEKKSAGDKKPRGPRKPKAVKSA